MFETLDFPDWCRVDDDLAIAKVRLWQVPDAADRLSRAIGVPVPEPNRFTGSDDIALAAIGPDEWLLTGSGERVAAVLAMVERATRDDTVQLLDLTDGLIAMRMEGAAAAACLAAYTPLDLRPGSFPVGAAVRTRFADLAVFVAHVDEAPRLLLICDQSYARYAAYLIGRTVDLADLDPTGTAV